MLQISKKAFTLIELLVVITIIGILATGAVTTFTTQIQKARDTSRISDVKALSSAIEQFYQDVSEYPTGGRDWIGDGNQGGIKVTDYLTNLAQDPKHDQTCNGSRCAYSYRVGADNVGISAGAYEISTAFENNANKATLAGSGSDTGNDEARLEIHAGLTTSLDTSLDQATAIGNAISDTGDTTENIVIGKQSVYTTN